MGTNLITKLEQLLQPVIMNLGYELWAIEMNKQSLRVYIDTGLDADRYITLDDCVKVSNQISAVLDVEGLIAHHYVLEVSSPGINRSLFKIEHYKKFIGHQVKVKLRIPVNGQRSITGEIKTVLNNKVIIAVGDKNVELMFFDIFRANLL